MSIYSFAPARCRFRDCGRVYQPHPAPGPWQMFCSRDCGERDLILAGNILSASAQNWPQSPLDPAPEAARGFAASRPAGGTRGTAYPEDRGAFIEPWPSRSPSPARPYEVHGEESRVQDRGRSHTPARRSDRARSEDRSPERGREVARARRRQFQLPPVREESNEEMARTTGTGGGECHYCHHAGMHVPSCVMFVPLRPYVHAPPLYTPPPPPPLPPQIGWHLSWSTHSPIWVYGPSYASIYSSPPSYAVSTYSWGHFGPSASARHAGSEATLGGSGPHWHP